MLRPGRLDVLLYVGVAEDSDSKLKVLQALTRKFVMEGDINLGIIAEKCPLTFTGADMYALSSDAWMTALKRTVAQVRLSLWFVVLIASSSMTVHAAKSGMFCFCPSACNLSASAQPNALEEMGVPTTNLVCMIYFICLLWPQDLRLSIIVSNAASCPHRQCNFSGLCISS